MLTGVSMAVFSEAGHELPATHHDMMRCFVGGHFFLLSFELNLNLNRKHVSWRASFSLNIPLNIHVLHDICREKECIGKYIPLGPRDFQRVGILHPEAREIARG